MNNKILLSLSLLSLALLQACGGGGHSGGGAPAGVAPTAVAPAQGQAAASAATNSGSVSAAFVRTERARYQLLGAGVQSFGALSASEQAPSGAMTRLSDTTLTGQSATREISGDANFALGRWVAGTVTRGSGAEMLTGKDNRAYHYIALNALAAMPTPRSTSCDAGAFTAPTYVGGGIGVAADSGSAGGAATLAFDRDGAMVGGAVTVSVGGAAETVKLDAKVATVSSTSITGRFLSGGSGAAIALGGHGDKAFVLAAGYVATLPSGARYAGIAKFRCS
ncbi:hypothetical protein VLK31_27115 [Variovorax sp. H27-G14]|uniref:hypothetical protein n=1 Tax=Variovorax sp. H27-G14 TaxID=3111914 RepID=UPI0038FCAB0B